VQHFPSSAAGRKAESGRAESAADLDSSWITKSPQGDQSSFNILEQNNRYLDFLLKNYKSL
jgi:hypothetical protein